MLLRVSPKSRNRTAPIAPALSGEACSEDRAIPETFAIGQWGRETLAGGDEGVKPEGMRHRLKKMPGGEPPGKSCSDSEGFFDATDY